MNDAKQQAWPWPNSLDALAAAPDHHTLLMENERVRMLETRIAPGDKTLVHTHCWLCVYHIMSWSDFIRYDDRGNVMLDSPQVERLCSTSGLSICVCKTSEASRTMSDTVSLWAMLKDSSPTPSLQSG